MYNEQAVKSNTPTGVIAGRVFYMLAVLAFVIALLLLFTNIIEVQQLMNGAQGLGVLANGYQAIQDLLGAFIGWLLAMAAGCTSMAAGLFSSSYK